MTAQPVWTVEHRHHVLTAPTGGRLARVVPGARGYRWTAYAPEGNIAGRANDLVSAQLAAELAAGCPRPWWSALWARLPEDGVPLALLAAGIFALALLSGCGDRPTGPRPLDCGPDFGLRPDGCL